MDEEKDLALAFWMLGVAIAHGLRFVALDDPLNRQIVAVGGLVIYSIAGLLAAVGKEWALLTAQAIAVVFPIVGVSAVLITGASVDQWQLTVGLTQFAALAYVLYLWAEELW